MAVYRPDPVLLERQIRSLQGQTVTSWVCYIGVDGEDPEAIRQLVSLTAGDDRFRIVAFPHNVGVYRNFQRLLALARPRGEWIALADQDDYWYPEKLERLLPLLLDDGVSAAMGQARLVQDSGVCLGRTRRRSSDVVNLLLRNQVTGCLAVFRTSVIDLAFPFPAATEGSMHDHWLGVCAAALGEIRLLDDPVQDYVQHAGNVLGEVSPMTLRQFWRDSATTGGLVAHGRQFAEGRWEWRKAMATAILARKELGDRETLVESIRRGEITIRLIRTITRAVRTGAIRPVTGMGLLATARRRTDRYLSKQSSTS